MEKKVLFSASIFHSLNDASSVAVPMILPLLYSQKIIMHSYSRIGILSYLGLLVTFLFQIVIAIYSDKFEYKYLLLISYSGICVSLFLITLASDFFVFLLFYLVLRIFTSFYHPIGISMVSRTHPGKMVDSAMGIQSGSGNLGVFIAFISIGYLAQNFNWKLPLVIWALTGFILGTISFISIKKTGIKNKDFRPPDFSSWMKTLKSIKIYIPGFVFGGICWGTTVYYLPSLLHHKFNVSMGSTGLYTAFWIGLGSVITYSFGFISRSFGRVKISLTGILGASFFLFLIGMAKTKSLVIISLLCFGVFLFLLYPAFNSFIGNKIPARNQALAFSLSANVQMLSGSVINLIAGFLSDRFGINTPFLLIGIIGILISVYYFTKKSDLYLSKA